MTFTLIGFLQPTSLHRSINKRLSFSLPSEHRVKYTNETSNLSDSKTDFVNYYIKATIRFIPVSNDEKFKSR